ncbi:DNA recombination protein RmuC [Algibacter lectus]|uniref:DNA recombination protein RmuC n=1 Tax=Algibacter lectus TaxID=221126 RepID=A0A090VKY9_9FLAO|nr:DNA recombination protein RmuC [Algibacter lectus]
MNDSLILILAIIISAVIGGYLGMLFTKLKSKSEKSTLEERNSNLQQQFEAFKQHTATEKQEQKVTISKIENDRENIRREKDFLNAELARRNTEFENLQALNLKRDAELEERQEQLRKDFEILATKILDEKSEKFTLQNKENITNIFKSASRKN